ncbi:putative tRNA-intron endonuclease [Encephalitozoon hellem ATCC 50504]|uniref:tRNA-intron lyase n=1 Tax=Encephalitozoon hellem TaxID=27973 RepID=A0A9Q9CBG3_ENCHE|nr:putative tRNA-intron endonuclease [Encephalitozoon hellem ATCC 50504]AFM97979.1 putative tRNA-intron endonuclease [Encephalitozoon hellem ATCC 50504]UTX42783.1 tRNA-intron endonuclease [Encephalitozoon hellem]WEL38242.1 tRNA-intron endonuclease [Encephalitozoon hellem]|eukprot:XP_003886960.1 putative tRNA-intron endonuclease [Encephalitozoon hellem ATCC 50504]
MKTHQEKREVLKRMFEEEGFVVGDGLKYGVDLLLYTDKPSRVHSKYGILIDRRHSFLDIVGAQRTCTSVNKTLVVVFFEGCKVRMMSVERMELGVERNEL